jgi:hypothetical protein
MIELPFRQILNIIYAMHVEDLTTEKRAAFDEALAEPFGGRSIRRREIAARARGMGQPVVIPDNG